MHKIMGVGNPIRPNFATNYKEKEQGILPCMYFYSILFQNKYFYIIQMCIKLILENLKFRDSLYLSL